MVIRDGHALNSSIDVIVTKKHLHFLNFDEETYLAPTFREGFDDSTIACKSSITNRSISHFIPKSAKSVLDDFFILQHGRKYYGTDPKR